MSQHIILTADDVRAIGGNPDAMQPIPTGESMAILPVALTDGTWALSMEAAFDATAEQRDHLETLPTRDVAQSEFQWWANWQARLAQMQGGGT
jgi:hypothetical protein